MFYSTTNSIENRHSFQDLIICSNQVLQCCQSKSSRDTFLWSVQKNVQIVMHGPQLYFVSGKYTRQLYTAVDLEIIPSAVQPERVEFSEIKSFIKTSVFCWRVWNFITQEIYKINILQVCRNKVECYLAFDIWQLFHFHKFRVELVLFHELAGRSRATEIHYQVDFSWIYKLNDTDNLADKRIMKRADDVDIRPV